MTVCHVPEGVLVAAAEEEGALHAGALGGAGLGGGRVHEGAPGGDALAKEALLIDGGPLPVDGVVDGGEPLAELVVGPGAGEEGCGGLAEGAEGGSGEEVVHVGARGGGQLELFGVAFGDAQEGEELAMELALDGDGDALGEEAQGGGVGRFGEEEGDGAGEAVEEGVVLTEVEAEAGLRQGAVGERLQEGMGEDGVPDGRSAEAEGLGEAVAHGRSARAAVV